MSATEIAMKKFSAWSQRFNTWLGEPLPRSYLVFDLETTGFSNTDLPIDFGYAIVRNAEVVHSSNKVLNWFGYPGIDDDWLRGRLAAVREGMEKSGRTFPYDEEVLRSKGLDPYRVIAGIPQLFERNREQGGVFVGHGCRAFDVRILRNIFSEMLDEGFDFRIGELFDTGLMEKSLLLEDPPKASDEDIDQFFNRISGIRKKGLRWNVDVCIEKYGIDMSPYTAAGERHRALFDVLATYEIFERHRGLFDES